MIPTAVAAAVLLGGVAAVLAWHPWAGRDTPSSTAAPTATPAAPNTTPALPTTRPPPPPPPVFPASDVDSVLLTPSEITNITGGEFEGYPSGPVEVINSSLGTSDNTHAIDQSGRRSFDEHRGGREALTKSGQIVGARPAREEDDSLCEAPTCKAG